MGVHRIIYVSRVARHVRFADAEAIAQRAIENNSARGITGILLYSPSHFLQVLEGPRAEVSLTLDHIRKDARHHELRVIDARDVVEREFSDWAMSARQLSKARAIDFTSLELEPALQLLRHARDSDADDR